MFRLVQKLNSLIPEAVVVTPVDKATFVRVLAHFVSFYSSCIVVGYTHTGNVGLEFIWTINAIRDKKAGQFFWPSCTCCCFFRLSILLGDQPAAWRQAPLSRKFQSRRRQNLIASRCVGRSPRQAVICVRVSDRTLSLAVNNT